MVAHGTASRPGGSRRSNSVSRCSARRSSHPSHTSPKVRPRSRQTRFKRTGTASPTGSADAKRSGWLLPPVKVAARARARARPCASSSPRWVTVCWRTLLPTRTERTSCQHVWVFPSLWRLVWRRYMMSPVYARGRDVVKRVGRHYTVVSEGRLSPDAQLPVWGAEYSSRKRGGVEVRLMRFLFIPLD